MVIKTTSNTSAKMTRSDRTRCHHYNYDHHLCHQCHHQAGQSSCPRCPVEESLCAANLHSIKVLLHIMIDPQIIILTSQHDQPISAPWTNFSFNLFAEKYSAQFNHTHYHWIIIIIDLNIRAALMTGRYAANTGSRYPCLFIYFGIG